MRLRGVLWKTWLIVLIGATVLSAQVNTGTISGKISDDTDAAVPGVVVVVKNVDTGLTRTLTSNAQGLYEAGNLLVGRYEVSAELSGFKTAVRSGIGITVGRHAVVNLVLEVGQIAEQVVVTGEVALVNTTSATASGLVDERAVRELPLNARSFTDLMDLQPGVAKIRSVQGTSRTLGFGTQFSVSGSHPTQNKYLLDGMNTGDARQPTPGSAAGNVLGTDTVREFRVLTSNYNAEFGEVSGGIMTAVTKSGTNRLSGSAFEYLRDSALDARQFFDAGEPPPFQRNQFGFTVGGPINRDRTFFFGSYEGLRQRLNSTSIIRVPNLAARRGFLPTGPCVAGCPVGPTAQKVLNLFPVPNSVDHGDGTAQYVTTQSMPTREDYAMVRLDHAFSQKHFMFGRYTFDRARRSTTQATGLFNDVDKNKYQNVLASFTSVWSSALVTNIRGGVNKLPTMQIFEQVAPDVSALVHVQGRQPGSVSITGLSALGPANLRPSNYWWTAYQADVDATYSTGRHTVKSGFSLQRTMDDQDVNISLGGTWTINSLSDFYAERAFQLRSPGPGADANRSFRRWIVGVFLQDDWKPTPNLTLNLGVRADWFSVPTETDDRISTLRNLSDRTVSVGSPWWETQAAFAHLSPRFGMAWDPFGDGKMSVRSGFGIYQQAIKNTEFAVSAAENIPFYPQYNIRNEAGLPLIYPDVIATVSRRPGIFRLDLNEFHEKQPYKMNWTFSVQREVLPETMLNFGYVGARGVNLLAITGDANMPQSVISPEGRRYVPLANTRPNPSFSDIRYRTTDNASWYTSLQIGIEKRFSRGFQFSSSYTWAKSIDTSSIIVSSGSEFLGSYQNPWPFDPRGHRGLSIWDLRHYWTSYWVYDLPYGRTGGPDVTGVAGKLFGGWSLGGVLTVNSGPPFEANLGFDYAGAQNLFAGQRPDLASGGSLNPVLGGVVKYFDPAAFELPPLTPECARAGATCTRRVFGNVGRNTLTGPGLATLDFSLTKRTALSRGTDLQFRAEVFNALNRANFGLPNGTVFLANNVRNATAGRITSVSTNARQVQFALKLLF